MTEADFDRPELADRLLRKAETAIRGRTSRILCVIERCTDEHNYSAVIRTCEALGVQHIWLVDPVEVSYDGLVDDDDDLREALGEQLLMTEDFDVFEADDGASAMVKAKEGLYDLMILDVGLPDTDGRELCRLMRKQGVKCPIVMLTAQDSDADTIYGLDAGANDYVSKPFKFPVLLARIRSQLRTHEQSEDAVFQLGQYTFKPAQKMLITEDDKKVRLTEKETNILKFLYRATDGVVARDVLLHEVWGYNAGVTTHTLETHIYRLRQKIETDPSNARLLVTEQGGYRLVG